MRARIASHLLLQQGGNVASSRVLPERGMSGTGVREYVEAIREGQGVGEELAGKSGYTILISAPLIPASASFASITNQAVSSTVAQC